MFATWIRGFPLLRSQVPVPGNTRVWTNLLLRFTLRHHVPCTSNRRAVPRERTIHPLLPSQAHIPPCPIFCPTTGLSASSRSLYTEFRCLQSYRGWL